MPLIPFFFKVSLIWYSFVIFSIFSSLFNGLSTSNGCLLAFYITLFFHYLNWSCFFFYYALLCSYDSFSWIYLCLAAFNNFFFKSSLTFYLYCCSFYFCCYFCNFSYIYFLLFYTCWLNFKVEDANTSTEDLNFKKNYLITEVLLKFYFFGTISVIYSFTFFYLFGTEKLNYFISVLLFYFLFLSIAS